MENHMKNETNIKQPVVKRENNNLGRRIVLTKNLKNTIV